MLGLLAKLHFECVMRMKYFGKDFGKDCIDFEVRYGRTGNVVLGHPALKKDLFGTHQVAVEKVEKG